MSGDDAQDRSGRKEYLPRIADSLVQDVLSVLGAVLITGPKWCGKSWTGMQHSRSQLMLGDDKTNKYARLVPDDALSGEHPRLVDEWQDVPQLWDTARRNIDLTGKNGMYIFTGSTMPPMESVNHSGTGRFGRVRMHTMSLYESGDSTGDVSLLKLFQGGELEPSPSKIDYEEIVRLICRGGWPKAAVLDSYPGALRIPSEYIRSVIDSDLSQMTENRMSATITERIIRSIARNVSSTASIATITKDVSDGYGRISEQTIRKYMDSLKNIFILEEQEAWTPKLRSKVRIRSSPKIHLTDPSLAAASLGATPEILKKDPNTAGFMFESLCYRDLCVYSSASGGRVYHYRDSNDLEIDNIVELPDGRWGAFEVKLGDFEVDK
ncbi:MAG: DUF4143 domain-containing protein, partial [Candidatus Methanoplasma sp.]|nr:DUF4143 domain-containing protein [Candidatus Methanoplasma sp.]